MKKLLVLLTLCCVLFGLSAYLPAPSVAVKAQEGFAFPGLQSPGTQMKSITGLALASAATIAPTNYIHHVTGTTAVVNITVPYVGFAGTIVLIPDGIFTTTTAGNIALASTAVVSKALYMTYEPGAVKWYPSY